MVRKLQWCEMSTWYVNYSGVRCQHGKDKPKALKRDSIYNIDMLF